MPLEVVTISLNDTVVREILEHAVNAAAQVIREDEGMTPNAAAVAVVQAYFAAVAEWRRQVTETAAPAAPAP